MLSKAGFILGVSFLGIISMMGGSVGLEKTRGIKPHRISKAVESLSYSLKSLSLLKLVISAGIWKLPKYLLSS